MCVHALNNFTCSQIDWMVWYTRSGYSDSRFQSKKKSKRHARITPDKFVSYMLLSRVIYQVLLPWKSSTYFTLPTGSPLVEHIWHSTHLRDTWYPAATSSTNGRKPSYEQCSTVFTRWSSRSSNSLGGWLSCWMFSSASYILSVSRRLFNNTT